MNKVHIRCPFCYADWEVDTIVHALSVLAMHLAEMNDPAHAYWRWTKLRNLVSVYRTIKEDDLKDSVLRGKKRL